MEFFQKMANCVWTEPAAADWGSGDLFSPFELFFEANGARRLSGYSQMGARRPRRLISSIFIDFHRFSFILGGFRASWARGLERPAAACSGLQHRTATPIN